MTQEHVAYESGVSVRHLQKIEGGKVDVRVLTLSAIAKVLKSTPQRLLDAAEEPARRRKA